jgi:hypothetical protein
MIILRPTNFLLCTSKFPPYCSTIFVVFTQLIPFFIAQRFHTFSALMGRKTALISIAQPYFCSFPPKIRVTHPTVFGALFATFHYCIFTYCMNECIVLTVYIHYDFITVLTVYIGVCKSCDLLAFMVFLLLWKWLFYIY